MDTRALARQLDEVIQPLGLECLGVEWHPAGSKSRLRVYIDCVEAGRPVDVDDCEAASRDIAAWLDVEDRIHGQYNLEVSSPGLDRPLFTAAQVAAAIGEMVQLKLRLARDGRRRLKGTVLRVDGNVIELDCGQDGPVTVDFADVEQARVEPDWAALGLVSEPRKGGHRGKGKKKRARGRAGRS